MFSFVRFTWAFQLLHNVFKVVMRTIDALIVHKESSLLFYLFRLPEYSRIGFQIMDGSDDGVHPIVSLLDAGTLELVLLLNTICRPLNEECHFGWAFSIDLCHLYQWDLILTGYRLLILIPIENAFRDSEVAFLP
jgi:hypothetical protein